MAAVSRPDADAGPSAARARMGRVRNATKMRNFIDWDLIFTVSEPLDTGAPQHRLDIGIDAPFGHQPISRHQPERRRGAPRLRSLPMKSSRRPSESGRQAGLL